MACTGNHYEDVCVFSCDNGYHLTGSDTRTCQNDASWSGNETECIPGECTVHAYLVHNIPTKYILVNRVYFILSELSVMILLIVSLLYITYLEIITCLFTGNIRLI